MYALQRQAAVTAYLKNKQLPLSVFVPLMSPFLSMYLQNSTKRSYLLDNLSKIMYVSQKKKNLTTPYYFFRHTVVVHFR